MELRLLSPQGAELKRLEFSLNVSGGDGVPAWWSQAKVRPPLPLPPGLSFGEAAGTYLSEKDRSVLVYVPGAKLRVGGADGQEESVEGFFIGKFEVTRAQLAKILGRPEPPAAQADLPATHVSWDEASRYCRTVGLRLPSEAEWELAARGTDGRTWPWGDEAPDQNHLNAVSGGLSPVGSLPQGASPYGCLDMAGNASEWVQDWLRKRDRHVVKGGSFKTAKVEFCQPTRRMSFESNRNDRDELGFRVARSAR
ncbi:MAG TPA: hypothetical protein DEA08_36390 [Planctomycetes bacterium]|nr:hypothetical protein [Planctomycetota bacterium]